LAMREIEITLSPAKTSLLPNERTSISIGVRNLSDERLRDCTFTLTSKIPLRFLRDSKEEFGHSTTASAPEIRPGENISVPVHIRAPDVLYVSAPSLPVGLSGEVTCRVSRRVVRGTAETYVEVSRPHFRIDVDYGNSRFVQSNGMTRIELPLRLVNETDNPALKPELSFVPNPEINAKLDDITTDDQFFRFCMSIAASRLGSEKLGDFHLSYSDEIGNKYEEQLSVLSGSFLSHSSDKCYTGRAVLPRTISEASERNSGNRRGVVNLVHTSADSCV